MVSDTLGREPVQYYGNDRHEQMLQARKATLKDFSVHNMRMVRYRHPSTQCYGQRFPRMCSW